MAFPLPTDPDFRKEIVTSWLDDIDDRLETGKREEAEKSWSIAREIYLSLPAGCGCSTLEDRIFQQRVKLDNITYATNENNQ
jgi:hypothetical protein